MHLNRSHLNRQSEKRSHAQSHLLSKSDFKIARECPAKLYYKKLKYPSLKDNDPYLRLLADGGFMVEEIARLQYADGTMIGFDKGRVQALADTKAALDAADGGDITLFEASFESRGRFIRVDIFRRVGNSIELIEVKSKSWNSGEPTSDKGSYFNKKGTAIRTKWQPYLEDVTYQYLVLEELFPQHNVIPYLLVPDRAKKAERPILHDRFLLRRHTHPETGFSHCEVAYTGNPSEVRGHSFLTRLNVADAVAVLRDDVAAETDRFVQSLNPLSRIPVDLGSQCFSCEYRTGAEKDGFAECWGTRGRISPHLVDLYYGSQMSDLDVQIARGTCALVDLDESTFTKVDGTVGTRNARQIVQVRHTRANTEWISGDLASCLSGHTYPLHFVDFETSGLAVPYHEGMGPYDNVAFQWSCHSIESPSATPTHAEWINTEDVYPNYAFFESLYDRVGAGGTVFIWSQHENTILRGIHQEMIRTGYNRPEILEWLERVVKHDKDDSTELVDMYPICRENYFHPRMGKRTSIKATLDAVWYEAADDIRDLFPAYKAFDANGERQDPYATLPPIKIGDTHVDVAEGTGAMRAYQAMMYGSESKDESIRLLWKDALLRYCRLDTAAMVIIWKYWEKCAGIG